MRGRSSRNRKQQAGQRPCGDKTGAPRAFRRTWVVRPLAWTPPGWRVLGMAVVIMCGVPLATAQEPSAEEIPPSPVDLTVKIINGTTRQPGYAESLNIQALGLSQPPLAEAQDVQGEVVLPALRLRREVEYLITAVASGASYYAKTPGWQLRQELQVTVYVFSTTTEMGQAAVKGMNLIMRQGESTLQLEFILTVLNQTNPQQSILPQPVSLELALPREAFDVQADLLSGPEMTSVATMPALQPGWIGLVVALTPGQTRLNIKARLAYDNQAEIPVGANLPIESWSVLSFPRELEVSGTDLELEEGDAQASFLRHSGPALAAGQNLILAVSGRGAPVVSETAAKAGSEAGEANAPVEAAERSRNRISLPLIMALVAVLLIGIGLWRRRRG